jgi:hypothetical protein
MRIIHIDLGVAKRLGVYIGREVWATSTFAINTTEGLLMEIAAFDRLMTKTIEDKPDWWQENIEESVKELRQDCKYYDTTLLSAAAMFTIAT